MPQDWSFGVNNVFVNRTLNMKKISHIGLDMDHTLVRYNSERFEALAYRAMQTKLVKNQGYPKEVLDLKFNFNRAVRGLVIDKRRGNIIKLSRFAAIRTIYHGLQPVPFKHQRDLYSSSYIDMREPDFDTVDTAFSISFATLYAQMVDLKDSPLGFKLPDYVTIAHDLNVVLDQAHRDGSLKDVVKENLAEYILQDPETVAGLERYKRHGKKVFIVTNAEYSYTKTLLDYTINPYLKDHKHWSELFTYVITYAQKPKFFFDQRPFMVINPETDAMTELTEKLTPGIYQGGNAKQFTQDLDLDMDEILYIGDHIYGDIVRLKKSSGWRTAMVIEELDHEVENAKKALPFSTEIEALMAKKMPLEIQLDSLITDQIDRGVKEADPAIDNLHAQISELDKKLSPLIQKQNELYNPHWGEIMRVGQEESYFAYQVERFACVYMAKLMDLLQISPRTYYRSHRRKMPHE